MNNTSYYLTVDALERDMKRYPDVYASYKMMDEPWKQRFVDYMMGRKTMPLTYDPFFKCIFNPDIHPEWLSRLLSAIIGEAVTVEAVLPSEDTAISVDSLLIMDIIVRLSDGALANVEIQKIPYQFAAERISCYSSDLLLREYTRLKQNRNFMYSDMKKVYTIVLYEKTSAVFKDGCLDGAYLHHGKTKFDTGLKLELLQEYFMIALDVFGEKRYTEDTNMDSQDDLDGWLSILTAETMADVEYVIRSYPCSKAIF
ncbi:Rpn family recombination-promoting nuclease/putative transposase [Eubacterium sp. MSJ-21]|nr:Rpn family recombination-promoting nuclease/putative transposase [Eubacterium sp. MSJ-21]